MSRIQAETTPPALRPPPFRRKAHPTFLLACFQVPQEPVERPLIRIMVFPTGEIANMPGSADVRSPPIGGVHDGVKISPPSVWKNGMQNCTT